MRKLSIVSLLLAASLIPVAVNAQKIYLYEHANYTGQLREFGPGMYPLNNFNDIASSIKVPSGMVAVLYEHATPAMGYGIWVDLLEDRPDLSVFGMNDKVSFINVFFSTKGIYQYARNALVNGQFIAGHWERQRANPKPVPANPVAVVGPAIPGPVNNSPSTLAVNGAATTITSLGVQSFEGKSLWETAMNDQLGIIGNDFRGVEEIGSAAFERESHNTFIPDNLNFWYPQRLKNDHRSVVFFKRTLAGKVQQARQVNIAGTYQDYDVNIDVVPDPKYRYLIDEGHPREYTALMSSQWTLSAHTSGQSTCDDEHSRSFFERVEAEVAEDYWPQGDHTFGRAYLSDLALGRAGKNICIYGPWIYDAGHCCQPEIHPAEQIWWSEPQASGKKYNLNVICDASRRFLWRKNMDDGTKLKPWAEPPIKGLFAIAFEYTLPKTDLLAGYSTKQFEVSNIRDHIVKEFPDADKTYSLIYQDKTLVTFIPHNNAFKVSFEHVGISPDDPGKIRGFLVIETAVGMTTQIATAVQVYTGNSFQVIKLPANSTPAQAPQMYEDKFFKKDAGFYYFSVTETSVGKNQPVFERRQ